MSLLMLMHKIVFNIISLSMCKYSFQLYYLYVYNLKIHMCITIITLILDVNLSYFIIVYTYMNFVIIISFNLFVCIKPIAENIMTNRSKGLQNIHILRGLFLLCYARIWQ